MTALGTAEVLPADGWVAIVQHGCHACDLVLPTLRAWHAQEPDLLVVSQDSRYPPDLEATLDEDLAWSRELEIEATPTLVRRADGRTVDRVDGWDRAGWRRVSDRPTLGADLPEWSPGCTAKNVDPERSARRMPLRSRRVTLGPREDVVESTFERGWTDGLPVVPPTEERVAAMLGGTARAPDDVVGTLAPSFAEVTVEKVAVNAVMAGCRPEYLPVVLAAVAAVTSDTFNIHGVAATTHFAGPVVIVNGPVTKAIGMNTGGNALGPGNRANATIGRALALIVSNVGGARPGGVDRSTLGSPGKLSFCFAEAEDTSPWSSLATERGVPEGRSAVTLFAGVGPQPVVDQRSRTPESLAGSLALSLRTVGHAKRAGGTDALVVIAPEHAAVFRRAGWDKHRLRRELLDRLRIPASELAPGVDGVTEGTNAGEEAELPKFPADGLWFVHAGAPAGQYSAIIAGWVNGPRGSQMTTREVEW